MKTALNNIRRSPYQAVAATMVTAITLFVISIFGLVSLGSHTILNHFETKPQVIAYLSDAHTPEQVNQLTNRLNSTGKVKSVLYVSKEDAFEIYKESVGDDPLLLGTVTDLGLVTADILPASIEVTVFNPSDFNKITSVLTAADIVSVTPQGNKEIDYPEDIVEELTKWTKAIRTGGLTLIAVLSLTSILTIMVIISLKIASRRVEIGTLKLIGASNSFILKPYIQEAVLYGLVGSVIGWLVSYIIVLYSTPLLVDRLRNIIEFPIPFMVMLILLVVLVTFSVLLSLISSLLAATRFIKR